MKVITVTNHSILKVSGKVFRTPAVFTIHEKELPSVLLQLKQNSCEYFINEKSPREIKKEKFSKIEITDNSIIEEIEETKEGK